MLRGDARQHPALRPRHRRRQPAVVRPGLRRPARAYGTVIAPPSFVFALEPDPVRLRRRAARHPRHVGRRRPRPGTSPIRRGTEVRDRGVPQGPRRAPDPLRRPGHPADLPRRLLRRRTATLLCSGDSWCFRTERDTARERGHEVRRGQGAGSRCATREDDLREIYDLYEAEEVAGRRAALPSTTSRSATSSPPMAKGPMTVTGFIAFAQGWGGLYIRANKLAYKQLRKHPGLGIPNRFGIPDVPERVHWEDDLATRRRHARRLRLRPRALLVAHAPPHQLDGRRRLPRVATSAQIRHHNVVGDWLRITGRVPASAPTTRATVRDRRAGGAQPARRPVGDGAPAWCGCRRGCDRRAGRLFSRRPPGRARSGREDAEGVAGRIGIDVERFVRVVEAVVKETGAERQRPSCWATSSSVVETPRSRCSCCGTSPAGHVDGVSCSMGWKARRTPPAGSVSTSQQARPARPAGWRRLVAGSVLEAEQPPVELGEGAGVGGVENDRQQRRMGRGHAPVFPGRHRATRHGPGPSGVHAPECRRRKEEPEPVVDYKELLADYNKLTGPSAGRGKFRGRRIATKLRDQRTQAYLL